MTVRELNQEQLDELKLKIFYLNIENEYEFSPYKENWDDDIQLDVEKARIFLEISNETIYKLFEGIDFVDDDFSCSCEKDKLYKIGIYFGKLIYVWEGYAVDVEQAREFAYEHFERDTYAEELED
jgi:hypothetical protein